MGRHFASPCNSCQCKYILCKRILAEWGAAVCAGARSDVEGRIAVAAHCRVRLDVRVMREPASDTRFAGNDRLLVAMILGVLTF